MKNIIFITAILITSPALQAAEYKDDWNYKNFYEAVNTCRSAIIYPSATDYEKKGLASKQNKETLRNEIIALTPASESVASEACYCAINEYAKDKPNADFIKNWETMAPYMETPRCKEKMVDSIKSMPKKIKSLILK